MCLCAFFWFASNTFFFFFFLSPLSGTAYPDSGSGFFRALSFSGGNNASVVSNPDGAMETSPSSGSITRNQSGNNLDVGNGVSEHKVNWTCFASPWLEVNQCDLVSPTDGL